MAAVIEAGAGARAIAGEFVAAAAALDFDGLARTLDDDVVLRALLPSTVVEDEGAVAAADRFRRWFEGYDDAEVIETLVEEVEDRVRVGYRLRVRREAARWTIEQQGVARARGGKIIRLDLVCTGFRPIVEAGPDGTYRYDAGSLACVDGLDGTLKEVLAGIPARARLRVSAGDPSARVEIPAFARLLGNEIVSVDDGPTGVVVVIERREGPRKGGGSG